MHGTIAYLANKNGDYVGATYDKGNSISYYPFEAGLGNIEKILTNYERDTKKSQISFIENSLEYIINHTKKRMIIFIITDISGLEKVQESTIRRLSNVHDVMFININDTNMTGENVYNIENSSYIPELILKNQKLHDLEQKIKKDLYNKCLDKLKKYRISVTTIDNSQEIVQKIIDLLERYRYANIR